MYNQVNFRISNAMRRIRTQAMFMLFDYFGNTNKLV